ncbi:MAG: shikimate dehydrogenase [Actinomycetota bacterium]
MPPALSGATTVVGLVGGPLQVERSLSPKIHNAAFAALDLDWVYVGFPAGPGAGDQAVRGLLAAGVSGLNVTMPHKIAAASAVDRLEGLAAAVGAVNTVEVRGSESVGWNTDGEGLLRFLTDAGIQVAGASVVVLGSGGAASSTVAALAGAGASSFYVLARDPARARRLRVLAGSAAFQAGALETGARGPISEADLIINATPIGQEGEGAPIPVEAIRPGAVVADLVYHPPTTRLVEEVRGRGARAYGGLGMLVAQAALSFEIWTGRPAPVEAMKAAAMANEQAVRALTGWE